MPSKSLPATPTPELVLPPVHHPNQNARLTLAFAGILALVFAPAVFALCLRLI